MYNNIIFLPSVLCRSNWRLHFLIAADVQVVLAALGCARTLALCADDEQLFDALAAVFATAVAGPKVSQTIFIVVKIRFTLIDVWF